MITSWRPMLPSPPQQQEPPPEPHIWDGVTIEHNAAMTKSAESLNTTIVSIIDHLPADQQSTFKNYQTMREHFGKEAKVP